MIDVAAELRYDPNEDDSAPGRSPSAVLRALVGAVSTATGRSAIDVYEGVCRYLTEHGIVALVLVQRGGPGRYAVAAHRLSIESFPKLLTLPRLEDSYERPVVYAPGAHPVCAHIEPEGALTFPALVVGVRPGHGGAPAVVSFFAPDLGPEHVAAGEAFAALLTATLARLDAERRLREAGARLEVRVRERTGELEALHTLSIALGTATNPADALKIAAEAAADAFSPDLAAGTVCTESRHDTFIVARGALAPALSLHMQERLSESLHTLTGAAHAGCASTPALITSNRGRRALALAYDGVPEGVVEVPVIVEERVTGLLALATLGPAQYSAAEVRLLYAIAGQLAAAIQRLSARRTTERRRLTALLEGVSDGVLLLTPDGQQIAGNTRGRRLLADLGCGAPGDALPTELVQLVRRALDAGETVSAELTALDPPRPVAVTATPTRDANDGAVVALALRETTDENLLRERLIQSEKMSSLGQLVCGVAHELNNPLTGILGFAQLLLARPLDDQARRDAETIIGEAERASKIVHNLLSFARQRRPEKVPVDINTLINRVLELQEYDMTVHDITVHRHLGERLPLCLADPHEIQQVLLNIITNARQAIASTERPGTITVTTTAAGGYLRIRISDDGPGIAPEHHRRIFDPFFTTKPVGEGTGLGLTISYSIVEEHGGHIIVESTPGAGATFTIDLPITAQPAAGESTRGRVSAPARSGRRVLVVDDEPAIQRLLASTLALDGHSVECAGSAAEALALLDSSRFDAIVVDVRMPRMSGMEFYRRVRAAHPTLARRIILTSGDTVSRDAEEFIEAHSIPFLPKPFDLNEVRELVSALAGRRQQAAGSRLPDPGDQP